MKLKITFSTVQFEAEGEPADVLPELRRFYRIIRDTAIGVSLGEALRLATTQGTH